MVLGGAFAFEQREILLGRTAHGPSAWLNTSPTEPSCARLAAHLVHSAGLSVPCPKINWPAPRSCSTIMTGHRGTRPNPSNHSEETNHGKHRYRYHRRGP